MMEWIKELPQVVMKSKGTDSIRSFVVVDLTVDCAAELLALLGSWATPIIVDDVQDHVAPPVPPPMDEVLLALRVPPPPPPEQQTSSASDVPPVAPADQQVSDTLALPPISPPEQQVLRVPVPYEVN